MHRTLWFAQEIIRPNLNTGLQGTGPRRGINDVSPSPLGDDCLFQRIYQHIALVFVFGSLRKTQRPKVNEHECNGLSTKLSSPG